MDDKKKIQETNKKIIILAVVALVIILVVSLVIRVLNDKIAKDNEVNVADIVKNGETKILFIKDSGKDEKTKKDKCKYCNLVEEELDAEGINYVTYDVNDYDEADYKKMLQTIDINPDDFGYPAVIYIKDGKLYSNVINITTKEAVKIFVKSYELKSVK